MQTSIYRTGAGWPARASRRGREASAEVEDQWRIEVGIGVVAVALVWIFSSAGCAALVRKPVEAATAGAVKGAEDAARPADVEALSRAVTQGVLEGLANASNDPQRRQQMELAVQSLFAGMSSGLARGLAPELARLGPATKVAARDITNAMVEAFVAALVSHRGELGQLATHLSQDLGRGTVRGAWDEMTVQASAHGGPDKPGPITKALGASAEAGTSGAMRGAMQQVGAILPPCQSADRNQCIDDFVRGLTRASAAGAAEGVEHKTSPWPFLIAFLAGAFLAVASIGGWRAATRRYRSPSPRSPGSNVPSHA